MTTKFTRVALETTEDGSAVELRLYCSGSDVFINEYTAIQHVELKGPGDDLLSDTREELVRRGQGTAAALGCDFTDCLDSLLQPDVGVTFVYVLSQCDVEQDEVTDVLHYGSVHKTLERACAAAQADVDEEGSPRGAPLTWIQGVGHGGLPDWASSDPRNPNYRFLVRQVSLD